MDMDEPGLTAWLAAVRAVHLAGCLLIGGVWAFDRLAVRGTVPGWRRLATALLWAATPLALVSGVAWLVLVTAAMSGLPVTAVRPGTLGVVWWHTQFGRAWQLHAAFWLGGAIVAATYRGRWAGLPLAAGLVGSLAWAGHGGTGPAPAWHRAADVVHLLASAVWPAGLVPFALLLRKLALSADPDRWVTLARLARRLSAASLSAVGLLTATGLFDSWCLLGSVGALFTTAYGRVLLVKLVLFTGMVGLGAFNLLVLTPRLTAGGTTVRRLHIAVSVEVVLGSAVVAAVGLLGLLEPAR